MERARGRRGPDPATGAGRLAAGRALTAGRPLPRGQVGLISLTTIYELSQIVGSTAVVLSLVFVGVELRRSTKATRAASHHAVTASLNELNMVWAGSTEVAGLWLSGLRDRSALPPAERWRFDSMLRAYLHVCETMYVQAALGTGDGDIVTAEENGIRQVFASPGVRDWWNDNPFGFSSSFRAYVDAVTVSRPPRSGPDTSGPAARP